MRYKPCLSCSALFFYYEGEEWKTQCLRCYLQKRQKQADSKPTQNGTDIPDDILKKLIILCHPDKHGNSEMSNAVTVWLLSKKQTRAGKRGYK